MNAFTLRVIRLIDNFIPQRLLEHDRLEELYPARMVVVIPFTVGVSNLYSCYGLFMLSDRLGGFQWVAWASLLASFLMIFSSWLFSRTGSFLLPTHIYAFAATLAITALIVVTGGFEASPFRTLLPLVMFFTFIMASMQTAVLWASIAMLVWLVGVNFSGIEYPNFIPLHWGGAVEQATVINAAICMIGILWFFHLFHRQLLRRLEIQRDRALFSAARDHLTGLANRKTFHQRLDAVMEQSQRTGGCHALLLMDLDDFKLVNDNHGHATGDLVLRKVAANLREAIRTSDLAARLGGDEFGLLLVDIRSTDDVEPIVEKLHRAVTAEIDLADNLRLRVGASIGVALTPRDGREPDQLLNRADQAMYMAKGTERGYRFVSGPQVSDRSASAEEDNVPDTNRDLAGS